MTQLGWQLRPIEKTDWDGLTGVYGALWKAAGRPNERLHRDWMTALSLPPPD